MYLTHLLDTSVYSQPLKKKPSPSVLKNWKSLGDRVLCVSVICEMEVLQGLEITASAQLRLEYDIVLKNRLPILQFDLNCARIYAEIQAAFMKKGRTRPTLDLMIASTAISKGLTVATCNIKDFSGIPGLKAEDWSV